MRIAGSLFVAYIALHAAAVAAWAQDSFYAGKSISLIVGSSPGGGMDAYGRLLSRHLGRHIPGNPAIVVQNMPGAGSLNSVMYLNGSAPKDGTIITTFNAGLLVQSIIAPDKIKANFSEYAWLGSISGNLQVCYTWGATGIKTWDELLNRAEVVMGDTGTGTTSYANQKILGRIFKVKLKQVLGYPGLAEKQLALERGELDGDCGIWSAIPEDWLRANKVNVVIRFQNYSVPGLPVNVPYVGDLITDPGLITLLELLNVSSDIGRPVVLSKAVPQERMKTLRSAFDAAVDDPQFRADAAAQKLDTSSISGAAVESLLKKLYAAPPEVIDMAKDILGDQ
jgi:tripartite-type tricarboxylate transporter receptor subunit TctC